MEHKQYDKIKLKDGREGTIVEVLGPDYIVDVGSSPKDWDTIFVKAEEIEEQHKTSLHEKRVVDLFGHGKPATWHGLSFCHQATRDGGSCQEVCEF